MAATVTSSGAETTACKKPSSDAAFNMASLRTHLPFKRKGLSRYYSEKSRSFIRLSDAKSLDDLKVEIPEAKRRKYASQRYRPQSSSPSCNLSCLDSSLPSICTNEPPFSLLLR